MNAPSNVQQIRSQLQFGDFIRSQRVQRGMTQEDLARICRSYPRAIINVEKGRGCSFELMLRIMQCLNVSMFVEPREEP